MGRPAALRPALIGYALVALTAVVTTLLLTTGQPFSTRLVHPYYTSVSLGLAGAFGLLIAATWRGGPLWWRVTGGTLCLMMFLWSASRGPLIALIAGLAAALLVSAGRRWWAVLLGVLALGILVLTLQQAGPNSVIGRFKDSTLNGRGIYWADALAAARTHPWGGVGPYQLGPYLTTQYGPDSCQLWLPSRVYHLPACPPLLNRIRGAWLIAHNTAFHLLGETGIIGLSGWLALMGAAALAAWRSRDPLINALTWATAAIGLVDTPTFVPNFGHAELYWLASGIGIALSTQQQGVDDGESVGFTVMPPWQLAPAAPLIACLLLGYFTLPLWLESLQPSATNRPVLQALTLPTRLTAGENVTVFLKADVPQGQFMLYGLACLANGPCRNVVQTAIKASLSGWTRLTLKGLPPGHYRLRLQLSDTYHGTQLRVERPVAKLVRVIDVE
ncbi:O-antigen ligase family protein [Deinococcus ruber]|nr:O-antigen ligase family protein [Deinococcus ruber]